MKTATKITLLILLLLTLSACAAPAEIPADLQITLERGPCFGTCPVYIVTIDSTGNVVYAGMQFVAVEGTQTTTISEEQLLALVAAFQEADFFSLKNSYEAGATDLSTTTTILTMNGESKTVFNYGVGCENELGPAPQKLCDLETFIDETVNVSRWVEGP